MAGLLDGQLAAAIAKGFRGKLIAGTLRKITATGRDANGDPVTTATDYACEGFREDYSAYYRTQAGIPESDCKITLIAGLVDVAPTTDDKIKISGSWFQVRKVTTDPASAAYVCQCFGIAAP